MLLHQSSTSFIPLIAVDNTLLLEIVLVSFISITRISSTRLCEATHVNNDVFTLKDRVYNRGLEELSGKSLHFV